MFHSERKRLMIYQFTVGLVVELAFAYLLVMIFAEGEESRLLATGLVWGAMMVASLLLWVKNTAAQWIAFHFFGRKFAAKACEADLRAGGFPPPEPYEKSPEEYFDRIASDGNAPADLRVKAAINAGYLRYPASTSRVLEAVRISMPIEDALNAMR